ncbi:LysE family transporter [Aestuariivirga sp.]|uniref:LysE family transporter n=1 Tax=Aestuariivirga sp. TaxID=2650926 RepID=UPI0037832F4E
MEALLALATVAAISCVGILSPGPDFIAVSYASMTGSRRDAVAVAAGVVAGNGIWAGAALLGVGTLFALFPSVFIAIKTLGALYLLWLGVQLLRSARRPFPAGGPGAMSGSLAARFSKGLSTTMSNPKAAVYYASALSSAAPAAASVTLLAGMLLTVIVIASVWFTTVVYVLSTPRAAAAFRRFKVYFESFFGLLLVSFGLRQMVARFL